MCGLRGRHGQGASIVGPWRSMGIVLLLGVLLVTTPTAARATLEGGEAVDDGGTAQNTEVRSNGDITANGKLNKELNDVIEVSTQTIKPPQSTPSPAPLAPLLPPVPVPPKHHIGGSFEVSNFTEYAIEFVHALNRSLPPTHVQFEAINLQAWSNLHGRLMYICDAVAHNNVTVFLAVGSQDMVNTLSIVTEYVGIPVIGYVTDTVTASSTVSSVFHIF